MTPIGGQSEFYTPLNDADAQERQLASSFGEGLYDTTINEISGSHYTYRLCLAAALALADAADWRVWMNSQPTKAIDMLSQWELDLGLSAPRSHWTIDQRWERVRSAIAGRYGANKINIVVSIYAILLIQSLLLTSLGYTYDTLYDFITKTNFNEFYGYWVSETDMHNSFTAPLNRDPTHELNRYEVAIMVEEDWYENKDIWNELVKYRDKMAPTNVRIALNCTTCYVDSTYAYAARPRWKWGQSRWSRDCWGAKAYSDGNKTLPYDPFSDGIHGELGTI